MNLEEVVLSYLRRWTITGAATPGLEEGFTTQDISSTLSFPLAAVQEALQKLSEGHLLLPPSGNNLGWRVGQLPTETKRLVDALPNVMMEPPTLKELGGWLRWVVDPYLTREELSLTAREIVPRLIVEVCRLRGYLPEAKKPKRK